LRLMIWYRSGAMVRIGMRMGVPEEPGDVVYDERLRASISLYGRDRGTIERWRKSKLVEVGDVRSTGRHAFDAEGVPFERYHSRGLLSEVNGAKRGEENEARYEAGLRFLGDWERGCRRPRLIADLAGCVAIGKGRFTRARGEGGEWGPWSEAYLAMDRWASCVQAVVCFDEPARLWADRHHHRLPHPGRVGMMALRLGLERLVRFYAVVDRLGRRD